MPADNMKKYLPPQTPRARARSDEPTAGAIEKRANLTTLPAGGALGNKRAYF